MWRRGCLLSSNVNVRNIDVLYPCKLWKQNLISLGDRETKNELVVKDMDYNFVVQRKVLVYMAAVGIRVIHGCRRDKGVVTLPRAPYRWLHSIQALPNLARTSLGQADTDLDNTMCSSWWW